MQIMFGTILWVLLNGLILTKATITPKDYTNSNIFQKENVSMYPELNFMQDISMSEESEHHILNFKSDRSHSDSTVRNEREVDEVTFANISIISESIESSLNKPTSLRAFVQFDSQFTETINDIFVTLRWNQPEFTDEIIQGYTVQCFFIEDLKEIQTCDDKNITTTKLEYTVHNLTSNTTYYFRVRGHTKIVAGPYTDLINVSTTHENAVPKLLVTSRKGIHILDVDLNITNLVMSEPVEHVTYFIQEQRIYWSNKKDLMTLKINENNITKIASFSGFLRTLCIDWVTRNLYFTYVYGNFMGGNCLIVKFDLTRWENGIIKSDEIFKEEKFNYFEYFEYLNVSPSMGILYYVDKLFEFNIIQYDLDRQNEQIVQINASSCLFKKNLMVMKIDNINDEEPLIYWLFKDYIIVTDVNISMCNTILHKDNISDNIQFQSMTIDKTNIYILNETSSRFLYILKKKYASLKSVNAAEYVEKITISSDVQIIEKIYAFDKSLQPYPPMRCLTPYEKVYNFENVTATANSIIVHFPEPIVKSGCKKYNLPTTIYTISVSHCFDNFNSEIFDVLQYATYEPYYEIQNLIQSTKYKLKFTLSNFYFDQLAINPFDSNVIEIKTEVSNLDAPENLSVLALTPIIAVVHWMPPKKLNCADLTYEVRWKSLILVNGTKQDSKQVIKTPKRMADGRFFTKINLSLPLEKYLIYVYVSDSIDSFWIYNKRSLNKIVHIYTEPNNITLSEVDINSMTISWTSNIKLTISLTLEYKDIAAEKWQTMNYMKMNHKDEAMYHVKNLKSGTLYKFRLILRYLEYEETFIWPADERFTFSTHGSKRDISSTSGIIGNNFYILLMLSFIVIVVTICVFYIYCLCQRRDNNGFSSSTMIDVELGILHEESWRSTLDECGITKIARNQIKLTKHLGSGAFGKVFQGKVKDLEESGTEISVAIKTLRKDASSLEKEKLLKEARLMNHIQHKHILRLLAVSLDGDSPLLVLELMETGNLLEYLRECRNLQASDSLALRLQDLFAMCENVARGCCYLEELRLVHRDLACRNCLVSSSNRENRVIKIGDFGLARNIYKDDYYRMRGEPSFPIRWMAPESLMIKKFTSKSDVWSFGVLMWEITSLGEQPYSDKSNEEVINYVRAGGRLSMTLNCPSPLYQLMLSCWSAADARPNFELCLEKIIILRNNVEDASLSPVDTI